MDSIKIEQPWAIDKFPLQKTACPISGTLLLPHSFRGVGGLERVHVYEGDDLNRTVFNHYVQAAPATQLGTNYIDPNGLDAKKHEYLGPSPFVAGYKFGQRGVVEVEWWDGFLQRRWVGDKV